MRAANESYALKMNIIVIVCTIYLGPAWGLNDYDLSNLNCVLVLKSVCKFELIRETREVLNAVTA